MPKSEIKMTITEVRDSVIESRGGECRNCDCHPTFVVRNGWGIDIYPSSSTNHRLFEGNLALRVSCDAHEDEHRPYTGTSFETCRARRHHHNRLSD
jgi:hypothetical protein